MQKILFVFILLYSSTGYSQITIDTNQVEDVYTEAIDARFLGDLAKARNLLENLKENNFTNEYVMIQLVEVYAEYLTELIQKNDTETLQIAYPGIRENLAEIWDLFPDSLPIQDSGLKIAWFIGDKELGILMVDIILAENPSHFLANYFGGMHQFTPQNYLSAIPYFKKVAHTKIEMGKEQFIFQSRLYIGDIYLEQKNNLEALKYYYKALELSSTQELIAKIAVLETYSLNFKTAISFFQNIPLELMSLELFNSYIVALWGENTPESLSTMNFLLSQNTVNSQIAQAIIQAQLGRTQKALKLLEEDLFIKTELPGSFYSIKSLFLSRLGQSKDHNDTIFNLGKFYYNINSFDLAQNHFKSLSLESDTNGEISYLLGKIASQELDYKKAEIYYNESLSKKKTLITYTELIEIEIIFKNYVKAEKLIKEVQETLKVQDIWVNIMNIYLSFGQDKFVEAEQQIQDIIGVYPNNEALNNFLAVIYLELERHDEAEQLLKEQLLLDPFDIITKNHLAYYYTLVNKNLDEALQLALSVVEEAPDNIIYLDTLAWVYTMREELELAQGVFVLIEKKLNGVNPILGLEEVYAHLGFYYYKIGDKDLSEKYFQQSFSLNPDDLYIKKLYNQVK